MLNWLDFSSDAAEIAAAGEKLLSLNEVAFLATVSAKGRPRVHPFVPKLVEGRLIAFVMDSSPKIQDLKSNGFYSIHTLPGHEDEEFFISGKAHQPETDMAFREAAAQAMGFVTGVDEHHILFEFLIDRALCTRWLDFGTPDHRPEYTRWQFS